MSQNYFIYILASKKNGTLYIGVTSNLIRRVWQHKEKIADGFTSQYNVSILVYYEMHSSIENAVIREKQLKAWKRKWKLDLIEQKNPLWIDLYPEIIR
ncbi:MAG: GIY-YIG nuclease family protein [bacterium]|nr:GIY-YIG nuclease family protein [bacterium]